MKYLALFMMNGCELATISTLIITSHLFYNVNKRRIKHNILTMENTREKP